MIARKLKPCKSCGKMTYLFSHGNCKSCSAKKSFEDKKTDVKYIADNDTIFFRYIWNKKPHVCAECSKEIKEFTKTSFHHILPKRKGTGGYPYFRYTEKNIIMLCAFHHGEAESAVSYPKMKIFAFCEKIKKDLLAMVGMEYNLK